MKEKYLLFFITLIFFSCSLEKTITNKSVIVIFDNYYPNKYKTPGGVFKSENLGFFYIDNLNNMVSYYPKKTNDTLVINSFKDYVEVGVSYRNFEEVYFLFHENDTVIFALDSLDYPVAKSKNDSVYTHIYNLNYLIRQGKTHHDMEPYVWLESQSFHTIVKKIDIFRSLKSDLINDYTPVDSLKEKFSSYKSEYLSTYNSYVQDKKITNKEYERALYWLKYKEIKIERQMGKDKNKFYHKYRESLTDSLIKYPSYHFYLRDYFQTFVDHKDTWIRHKNGSNADYRICFDDILADSLLPPLSKNVLLQYCMQDLSEYFSGKDINTYLSKYLQHTRDTAFYNKLTNNYNLTAEPNELQLKSLAGNTSTLIEVIKQHKGKLLYIDFWASWCAPCKAELPYSHRLQEKYEGKDIVFIYLAYNDLEEKWRKACVEMGLNNPKSENYLITNFKTSSFITDLSINTIPRYLLYDKDGRLIYKNAPRPSTEEIIKVINANL